MRRSVFFFWGLIISTNPFYGNARAPIVEPIEAAMSFTSSSYLSIDTSNLSKPDFLLTCPAPTNLAATNITGNSATLVWNENGSSTKWMVIYGPSGFDPNLPGTNIAVQTVPSTSISGLTNNTAYDFYVKAICVRNDTSSLIGPLTFTTLCVSATIPYVIDFNSAIIPNLPICTSTENIGSGNNWGTAINPGYGFNSKVLKYSWSQFNTANSWFYTQGVELIGGTVYQISYKYGNDDTYNTTEKMKVSYGMAPTAAQMTNSLANYPRIRSGQATVDAKTFIPATSGVYYFGFQAYSDSYQYFLFLDDIQITVPSCPAPSTPTISSITENTAELNWTAGLNEIEWEVIYGTSGFDPNTMGTIINVLTNPHITLNGLNDSTNYELYVKSVCSLGNSSQLIGPITFSTPCMSTTIPYLMNFESTTIPHLPNCTSSENIGDGNDWTIENNPGSGFSGNVARYAWNTNYAADAWFYTQGVELVAGSDYQISYKYGNDNTFISSEKMKVAYGMSPEAASMTQLANHSNINNGGATENRAVFSPTISGIYYFGFHAYSNPDQYHLYLDDIKIEPFSGYLYSNGIWTPGNPSGISTAADNILIRNGSANLTANTDVHDITIMAGATLEIHDVLNLNGNITNNGNLVFVSTATSTGELGFVSMGSVIQGNATVQNYMKNQRSYRMVSSAVTTSNSIHANWQEGATSNTHNPNPGFGTHITGSLIDQQNGFDKTSTGNPSMFTVNVATQQFQAIGNTDLNILEAGNPYLLFVRGGRDIDLNNNLAAGETVLRATGSLFTGTKTQNFPTASTGNFVMFGNPYQSTVDINNVFAGSTNLNTAYYYIYDPTLGDYGGYVAVDLSDGTNLLGSAANQFLQPGQGAQVAVLNVSPTVKFEENDKAPGNFTSTSLTNNKLVSDNMLTVQLYTSENYHNGGPVHDGFGIIFNDGNDNGLTPTDAVKPMNFYENLGIDHVGTYLSIERRKMPQSEEIFQLYATGYQHSDYILKMTIDGLEGFPLYLEDRFTGISTSLGTGDAIYHFTVDSSDPMSIATDRFYVRTGQRLGVDANELFSGIRLYPNPLNANTFYINAPQLDGEELEVSISDLTGRIIFDRTLDCNANTVTVPMGNDVTSGIYLITIKHGVEAHTYKLIKE